MLLSKVSKLLEEGRLRQGVVLVNYRLIVKMVMEMVLMVLMVLMMLMMLMVLMMLMMMMLMMEMMLVMEMMLIMLAFYETSHTRVIVTENISGRQL